MANFKQEESPISLSKSINQSPPVDVTIPYDLDWLSNKHIVITGGASGFGAALSEKWAATGSSVIVSDINEKKGQELVEKIKSDTKNDNVWFVTCDVRNWEAQVNLFRTAVKLSPHGGIDIVVANAGVAGPEPVQSASSSQLDAPNPPPPDFRVLDINLTGALYTAHLALHHLSRNPQSQAADHARAPSRTSRDRHLLLVGSMASVAPIPTQPLYGASKHGVLGAFRTLRASTFLDGVRVNMIAPYFIKTPIVTPLARMVLAGGGLGCVEDVVDAASRLCADSRISGRMLMVGPKVKVVKSDLSGEWVAVEGDGSGEERAVWEAYADDFEETELFTKNVVRLLNAAQKINGWTGWFGDMIGAIKFALLG